MIPKRAVLLMLAAVGLTAAALLMTAAMDEPATYHGTHLSPSMPAAPFTLHSADGPISLADLEGSAVVLFFGYTSCPDICPITMLRLSNAVEALGDARERVQVVFVTVDPERDSPERATQFATAINPSFLGVSGTEQEIADVAADYGIYRAKAEGSDSTGYLMDHTGTTTVLNPRGEVELLWSHSVGESEMTEDLKTLLRR